MILQYQRILILKTQNKKTATILNDTFEMLDIATTEYNLSVDVLKERIKSVQKYYENIKKNIEENSDLKQKKDALNFEKQLSILYGKAGDGRQCRETGGRRKKSPGRITKDAYFPGIMGFRLSNSYKRYEIWL